VCLCVTTHDYILQGSGYAEWSLLCVCVQESALRSRHITVVKKGWLSKGPDSNQDASIVSFTRVSVSWSYVIWSCQQLLQMLTVVMVTLTVGTCLLSCSCEVCTSLLCRVSCTIYRSLKCVIFICIWSPWEQLCHYDTELAEFKQLLKTHLFRVAEMAVHYWLWF